MPPFKRWSLATALECLKVGIKGLPQPFAQKVYRQNQDDKIKPGKVESHHALSITR